MLQYVLDTDHISLLQRNHPILTQRCDATPAGEIAITVISIEEQMQGWLSEIRKASQKEQSARLAACRREGFCGEENMQTLQVEG